MFVLHLSSKLYNATLHSEEVNEVFSLLVRHCSGAVKPPKIQVICCDHCFALQLYIHFLLYHFCLSSSQFNPKTLPFFAPQPNMPWLFDSFLSNMPTSVNFFNFPNNLLLKNGQDSIIFTYLFKHHPTVKLVAYLLEIIPKRRRKKVSPPGKRLLYLQYAENATLRMSKCYNIRNQCDCLESYFKV